MKKDTNKKKREQEYLEAGKVRFVEQQKILYKPNIINLIVQIILLLSLIIWDKPSVVFDSTSILFMLMLMACALVPIANLLIVHFGTQTSHLLITLSLYQLCIIPLIVGFAVKYDELSNCSSWHMLGYYGLYFILYLVMTTMIFNLKTKLSTPAHK